jgi:hypothetical protein
MESSSSVIYIIITMPRASTCFVGIFLANPTCVPPCKSSSAKRATDDLELEASFHCGVNLDIFPALVVAQTAWNLLRKNTVRTEANQAGFLHPQTGGHDSYLLRP